MKVDRRASQIDRENDLRAAFVNRRLEHEPEGLEAMDLTQFMHGGKARLLCCTDCGTAVRDEDSNASYEHDVYDSALLNHLYPRYLSAFRRKRAEYGSLLRQGAEVVEVGSHLGAFLQSAEEWGWRPTGLDIGSCTADFARRRGASVKRIALQDYSPKLRKPEGIFIWNCFEQLSDPGAALRASHRLLDRHGMLVVRIPNAEYYRTRREVNSEGALCALGYNNLLGFPYLHGYTDSALRHLLRGNGFEPLAFHSSSLLTPPYPDFSRRIRREWTDARKAANGSDSSGGPWLEIVSRRTNAGE